MIRIKERHYQRVSEITAVLKAVLLAMVIFPGNVAASTDYFSMDLEELMQIKVTSASRRPQRLSDVAAAIFVITPEDLRRSGVTNVPEALRMVPGLEVARINSSNWAISARGFNNRFANKLLVLVDGRNIYSPIFSGVFWEEQDLLLDNIERIEVIRGPGGSLWGVNAVNGIINIITKKARDTQGYYVKAGGGTYEKAFGALRYGGKAGRCGFYRFYMKGFDRGSFKTPSGRSSKDGWQGFRSGFRMDLSPAHKDALRVSGDFNLETLDTNYLLPSMSPPYTRHYLNDTEVHTGNILLNWQHKLAKASRFSFKGYYDWNHANDFIIKYRVETLDLEAQACLCMWNRHDFTFGAGYRHLASRMRGSWYITFDPENQQDDLYNAFIQDEISLLRDRLALYLGTKVEHNPYTGFEIQPSIRLLWKAKAQTFWAAISRAVHTPDMATSSASTPAQVLPPSFPLKKPITIYLKGNKHFTSEILWAYEAGYRTSLSGNCSLDIAVYMNRYRRLLTIMPESRLSGLFLPYPELDIIVGNKMRGETYGAEFSARFNPFRWWHLQAAYTYERLFLHSYGKVIADYSDKQQEGKSPRNQFSLRSSMDLPENLSFDAWLRYVDNLSASHVPAYLTMDLRLAWKPRRGLELAITGRNLLDNRHPEFVPEYLITERSEVIRSLYGQITWNF